MAKTEQMDIEERATRLGELYGMLESRNIRGTACFDDKTGRLFKIAVTTKKDYYVITFGDGIFAVVNRQGVFSSFTNAMDVIYLVAPPPQNKNSKMDTTKLINDYEIATGGDDVYVTKEEVEDIQKNLACIKIRCCESKDGQKSFEIRYKDKLIAICYEMCDMGFELLQNIKTHVASIELYKWPHLNKPTLTIVFEFEPISISKSFQNRG